MTMYYFCNFHQYIRTDDIPDQHDILLGAWPDYVKRLQDLGPSDSVWILPIYGITGVDYHD